MIPPMPRVPVKPVSLMLRNPRPSASAHMIQNMSKPPSASTDIERWLVAEAESSGLGFGVGITRGICTTTRVTPQIVQVEICWSRRDGLFPSWEGQGWVIEGRT